jgi:hypothetical protein
MPANQPTRPDTGNQLAGLVAPSGTNGDDGAKSYVKPRVPSMRPLGRAIYPADASALPALLGIDPGDAVRDGRESMRERLLESLPSDLFEARLATTFD